MKITDIKNCIWANENKTAIDCEIKAEEFKDYIPYTASKNDPWSECVQIFEKILAEGHHIRDFVPRPIFSPPQKQTPSITDLEKQLNLLTQQLEELKKQSNN